MVLNNFQSLLWFALWLVPSVVGSPPPKPDGGRSKFDFNRNWKVSVGDVAGAQAPDFDDSDWKVVTTPYAWNEDDAFRVSIESLSTGIAWYRKHFEIAELAKDKKVFLEFEGIRHGGEFYLNDKWIGRSENGVMAFGFDISDTVLQGKENVIAARIDNSWDYRENATNSRYQWADKNFYANYGGINKNVLLHITDKLYQTLPLYSNLRTTGVYVYPKDIDIQGQSATITAESEIRNEHAQSKKFRYSVLIEDLDGNLVQKIEGEEFTLPANATRTISASAKVSGLKFWSWGYGQLYDVHTSLNVDGKPVDTVSTRTGFRKTNFDNGMFKLNDRTLQLKGYAQRTTNEWVALGSAVPAWLSDFSNKLVLDSGGSLIRWMHVTPWKQDVESCDRLGILQELPAGDSERDPTGRTWEMRTELMRDAIIYNRNNPSVVFYESGNTGVTEEHMQEMKDIRDKYDPHGGRASGSREMMNSTVAEFGGEMLYINKGARIPFFAHEYSRDEGLRKYWDELSPPYHKDGDGPLHNGADVSSYNRNQDSQAIETVVRWAEYYENRPGTGKRVSSGGVNIVFSDSNTHHRGAENYRRSGEVDAVRLPKDSWYTSKVMWDTWVDAENPASHLVGHWTYNDTVTKNVTVISTAPKTELFLNGKSLGFGTISRYFLHTFTNVKYEPGELKVVGYDKDGKEVTSDSKQTAGQASAIRLTPHTSPNGFFADGSDIALVDVEVIDAEGKRNPIALSTIDFSLSGEAEWRGGIAQGPDNYILSKSLPVENGVNRILIRSTTKAGKVTISAQSEGLTSASITLDTKEAPESNGLSERIPGYDLPIDLSRGPTPAGESYKMTTKPLTIASATAGSNPSTVSDSYDDNEETTWRSSTAADARWITYTLTEESKVNRVVFKLRNFRNAQGIEIKVGDKVVFDGTTPGTLGYAHVPFDAATGRTVTVRGTKGEIGITEVEIYGPVE